MLSALAAAAAPNVKRCSSTPPRWTQKRLFSSRPLQPNKHLGMSYEYHKHPKKNWGQPPAFASRTLTGQARKRQTSHHPFSTNEPYMYICAKGGRVGIYSFPSFLFVGESTLGLAFPSCMACVFCRYHWISKEGYLPFFCTASFSLRFNLPFFRSGSLSSHDLP